MTKDAVVLPGAEGLEPLGPNVFIVEINQESVTKGGIVLPNTANRETGVGRVVGIGPEVTYGIKVGDIVTYARYSGQDLYLSEVAYKLMDQRSVLGRVIMKGSG
jgi:chaperonin GroES